MDQNTLYFNYTSTARPRKAMKLRTECSAPAGKATVGWGCRLAHEPLPHLYDLQ